MLHLERTIWTVDPGWTSLIPSRWVLWCALRYMMAAQNQNWMAWESLAHHWCHEVMIDMGDIVPHQLQINEKIREIVLFNEERVNIPVIRLSGSKISIFSSKSRGSADIRGHFAERSCFPNCGSCLRYLFAFSLRRNPRLDSSGEPINFFEQKENKMHISTNKLCKR